MSELEPVTIYHARVCAYKAKPCATCGLPKANKVHGRGKEGTHEFRKRLGCDHCGQPKGHRDHLGAPESFNVFGDGGGWQTYQSIKKRWAAVLVPLLQASGLPRGLARIVVEGEATFPDRQKRDQGNFRVGIEKALGDVLARGDDGETDSGGWLTDDTWDQYEFGNLTKRYEAGVSAIRLTLFPSYEVPEAVPDVGDALRLDV